jgi:hypothetical protein
MRSRAVPFAVTLLLLVAERKAIADALKIIFYLERATGWRDLLASWAGSFHVFSTLPLSFDLIALGVEVVE